MALRLRAVAATLLLVVGVITVYNGMWARDVVRPTVSLAPEAVPPPELALPVLFPLLVVALGFFQDFFLKLRGLSPSR